MVEDPDLAIEITDQRADPCHIPQRGRTPKMMLMCHSAYSECSDLEQARGLDLGIAKILPAARVPLSVFGRAKPRRDVQAIAQRYWDPARLALPRIVPPPNFLIFPLFNRERRSADHCVCSPGKRTTRMPLHFNPWRPAIF